METTRKEARHFGLSSWGEWTGTEVKKAGGPAMGDTSTNVGGRGRRTSTDLAVLAP